MIIGLTGNTGSGKSTVALLFQNDGYHIVDCDAISKKIDSLPEYREELVKEFGPQVVTGDSVNRKLLGGIVFTNAEKLSALNAISHPYICKLAEEEIEEYTGLNIVIDAPLLFHSPLTDFCDFTVGVIAKDSVRLGRITERDGISAERAKERIASQDDESFFEDRCDYIIHNDGTLEDLEKQYYDIVAGLEAE